MPEPTTTTIHIESSFGSKLTMVVPFDTDITEWENIFKVILMFLTFDEETIEEVFPKKATTE